MKQTQSFWRSLKETGARWGKNAGDFMRDHPMLTAGIVGGSLLITGGGLSNRPDPQAVAVHTTAQALGMERRPQRVPRPPREAVATQHSGPPVLLGQLRGIHGEY